MRYETTRETPLTQALIKLLVDMGYLVQLEDTKVVLDTLAKSEMAEGLYDRSEGLKKTLNNGLPIETNIEKLAKHFLGMCEDRKLWVKELKAAVKEHGHDEVLSAFEEWASAQGTYMGRKPVSQFLKNVGSNVGTVNRAVVTNPNLSNLETRIAYITNNTVFFTGDYRLKLAQLLKENGNELVEAAFADFFQNVDDRGLPWAARDFLQRAQIMINTIKIKRQQAARQEATLANAYQAAANSVEEVEEDEEL